MASEKRQESLALSTSPQMQTYAQILAKHGWKTGGFVSSATAKKITGLAAGFQAWSEPEDLARPGREALADSLAWLEKQTDAPFFLWLHLFDVHGVPDPHAREKDHGDAFPEDAALRGHMDALGIPHELPRPDKPPQFPAGIINGYDGSIVLVDGLVKQLVEKLRALPSWDRTILVITADHGEGLGQHQYVAHALTWGEQLRVPLIVRVPGRAPERRDEIMSSIDVLPTLFDLAPGLPSEELRAQATGRSVVASDFDARPVFSMAPANQNEYSLTMSRWKYIRRPKGSDALYDLEKDPHELVDLLAADPPDANAQEVAARMKEYLATSMKNQRQRNLWLTKGARPPQISAEEQERQREALKKLGYVDEGEH